jgi:UDP-N-acetylglucosamine 4,6-dehydratase/5-epimerase
VFSLWRHPRVPNVLYSRGSVLTVWEQQLKDRQPLTLTEPGMTRFVITMGQAGPADRDRTGHDESGDIFGRTASGPSYQFLSFDGPYRTSRSQYFGRS